MNTLADKTITTLRHLHDALVDAVTPLSDDTLADGSGASKWSVAQVLSHLGSGAKISDTAPAVALGGVGARPAVRDVWNRWDPLTPREQAAGFVAHGARLLETLESIATHDRDTVRVDMPYFARPATLSAFAGLRLGEVVLHGWDVAAALDPAATVPDEAATLLLGHHAGDLDFVPANARRVGTLSDPAAVVLDGTDFTIVVDTAVGLRTDVADPTATLTGGPNPAVRLIAGRLDPAHTPAGTQVRGNVTLEELRTAFPGY